MDKLIYREESFKVVGACLEVYGHKGCDFLEPVYQECLEIELELQGIDFISQKLLALEYKGRPLKHTYYTGFYLLRQNYFRNQSRFPIDR